MVAHDQRLLRTCMWDTVVILFHWRLGRAFSVITSYRLGSHMLERTSVTGSSIHLDAHGRLLYATSVGISIYKGPFWDSQVGNNAHHLLMSCVGQQLISLCWVKKLIVLLYFIKKWSILFHHIPQEFCIFLIQHICDLCMAKYRLGYDLYLSYWFWRPIKLVFYINE